MATMVLTDCFISIDDVEVSSLNTKVALHMSAAAVDQTAMGDGTKKNAGGLKDWSVSAEFNGDATTDFFDKIGTVVPVEIRASSAAVSPDNPSYTGDALITEFVPLDGAVGDNHKVSITMVAGGPLTRSTTAA